MSASIFTHDLQPISAVIFDCDSTLSAIEGIDELASASGVYAEVCALTQEAMEGGGLTPALFAKRLALVKPTKSALITLAARYWEEATPDAAAVITALQDLGKTVFIISAGLNPAVKLFGKQLKVKPENIFAVDTFFDEHGNYLAFDEQSPLIHSEGKRVIISEIKKQHPHLIHVGDGLNDLAVKDLVTRFIGFGGIAYRETIARQCDHYISERSLRNVVKMLG